MKRKALIFISILSISIGLLAEITIEQKKKDLEEKLKSVSGKEKIEILNQLAYSIYDQYPKKCIEYSRQALKLSRDLNLEQEVGMALKIMGIGYGVLGENEKSLENTRNALKIFKKIGDKINIAHCLTAIGVVYLNMSQYDTALDHFLNSLKICEDIAYKKGIKENANNIGIVHFRQENFKDALIYYQKSLQIDKELENKIGIATSLNNIGLIYQNWGKYDQAIEYYLKALRMSDQLEDKAGMANTWMNLGITYSSLEDYGKSEEYLQRSLKMASELNLEIQIIQTSINLGEVYSRQKKHNLAIIYLQKALKGAKAVNSKEFSRCIFYNLSEIYSQRGDYQKALEYHRLFFKANQEIFNQEKSKQITEMQTRYETFEKEKRIEILEKNNQIQKLQLSKERVTRNAFIMGFILVIIALVLLFRKYLYLFTFWKKQKYIGQFRLMEKIGSGGMGVIYKAHHIKNKSETYAIKVLREELSETQDIINRFKQEATIIDKLDHPHIVKIMERGQYKQRFFIAMELLKGKTLETKLAEEGQMYLNECLHIMKQITAALSLIHSKNIIHRDLKPSNIMLVNKNGDNHFVKLLDFGVARMKFQTKLTKTGILLGTTNYLAPEQINNTGISTASDLFSLGIIFYEMVCGTKPFIGDSESDIIKDILEKQPMEPQRLRDDVPHELNTLIMRMLEKRKESRPSSPEVLEILHTMNNNL
jgi:tetratricopeptide (TPR) repeat protein